MSSLPDLVVLGTLDVGPPVVTARRIVVPYRISGGPAGDHATSLTFAYDEDVLDPGDPASLNLAAVIGAQVALNYGIFTRRIVFHGLFDAADRALLADALENTSVEIYANKLLHPNVFLRPPASGLVPEVRARYTQAELVFADPVWEPSRRDAADPEPFPGRVAVLASGGKDSLLTQGMLESVGCTVDALFVNESGRHWYSALNGFRHLAATRSGTARVWTDCDRLFNWFLRRIPFVRQDFARLRADYYPLRLWTVAVFLTAVLPIVRKRGITRIFVGDEIDTTRREVMKLPGGELVHYDGVYDQSIWFDQQCTAWYAAKGWNLLQASVLRPMGEALIQLGLAVGYPELLREQVSCHAASIRGARVVPCGRCAKCRRIVGSLLAGGADPGACGYDPVDVDRILIELAKEPMNQDFETSAHIRWSLRRRGLLGPTELPTEPHPEALALRFDPVCCPPGWLPEEITRVYLPFAGELAERVRRATGG